MVPIRALLLELIGLVLDLLLEENTVVGMLNTRGARLIDAHLWIWGRIVFASTCIATSLFVSGVLWRDPAGWRTLHGLSLSQLSLAVAQAPHASIARSFVRLDEVLPSASSFSWTAWCRCRTSLVVVNRAQHEDLLDSSTYRRLNPR